MHALAALLCDINLYQGLILTRVYTSSTYVRDWAAASADSRRDLRDFAKSPLIGLVTGSIVYYGDHS